MKKQIVLIVLLLLVNSSTLLAQINKPDSSASKKDAGKSAIPNTAADKKANDKALKQAIQKKQADSIANVKSLKLAVQKKQADSVATVKALKVASDKSKKDSISLAKSSKISSEKNKKDSISIAKSSLNNTLKNKKDTAGSAKTQPKVVNKTTPDSIHTTTEAPRIVTEKNKTDTALLNSKISNKDLKKQGSKKGIADTLSAKSKSKEKPPKVKSAKELKKEAKKNDVNNLSDKALAQLAFKEIGSDTAVRNQGVKRADISFTNARPLPLAEVASNNIQFYHRYWRDIDLQDPKNKRFASYHSDLIYALFNAIKNKELRAYNPAAISPENPSGDAFTVTIPYPELMSGLSDTSVVNIMDKDGNITGTKTVPNPFTPEKISGYRIKEDVFYDKTRAKYITRIIGIAPLVKLTLSSGEVLGIQPLCWLRFKDCRKVLVTIDVDPSKKIGDSMDDVFLQRRFYGRIVQESNPEGKRIKDYKTELPDQEIEAKRIEQKILAFKKGSWNYIMLNESPVQEVPVNNRPVTKTKKDKETLVKPK